MSLEIKRRSRAESSIRLEAEKMVVVVSVPGNQAVDVSQNLFGLEEVARRNSVHHSILPKQTSLQIKIMLIVVCIIWS